MTDNSRYAIDLDWVWGPANPDLTGVARLRATVSHPKPHQAERKIDAWFASFDVGEGDSRWQGGWAVTALSRAKTHVVLELVSGGQDVAESLTDAIDSLYDAVGDDETKISWEPQPIERDDH